MGETPETKTEAKPPEQEAMEKALRDAGYQPGITTEAGEVVPLAAPTAAAPESEAPKAAPPVEAPKPKWTDEEVEKWKDRAGWAEREKERADRERADREALVVENARLKAALGAPQPAQPATPKREYTPEELQGIQWLGKTLRENPEVLAEALAVVPPEVLGRHPAFQARDVAIFRTRDEVEKASFLSMFRPEDRRTIAENVIPALAAKRQATGFRQSYEDLWKEQRENARRAAELYGLQVQPEQTPTTPVRQAAAVPQGPPQPPPTLQTAPVQIPPSLSGVRSGASAPVGAPPQTPPMTIEELKMYGFA